MSKKPSVVKKAKPAKQAKPQKQAKVEKPPRIARPARPAKDAPAGDVVAPKTAAPAPAKSQRPEVTPQKLAWAFHEAYERLAPKHGYKTREDTKDFDADSPNGRLMIEVASEMLVLCKTGKLMPPPPPPKPAPPPLPMQVYVASAGNTSFVLTARNPGDAREFLSKIRDNIKGVKFRAVDQTKRQVWGLFPIMEVVIDGEGRVDIKRIPAEPAPEETADGEVQAKQE